MGSVPHSETATPRTKRNSRKPSRDDSIYEPPPSPRASSRDSSPQRPRQPHGPYFQDPSISMHQQRWRPFAHPQPYIYYPPPTAFRRFELSRENIAMCRSRAASTRARTRPGYTVGDVPVAYTKSVQGLRAAK
ncbi:unnamed protein product [Strongylus vulgaris]|uniref:Uncharacterized protein n=1 Tax=Strongylus vulgaris TaxID=40348 RepID=A0A3P7IVW0_STRVU|nr:unnamed protein product [Strongylus vulgaris]